MMHHKLKQVGRCLVVGLMPVALVACGSDDDEGATTNDGNDSALQPSNPGAAGGAGMSAAVAQDIAPAATDIQDPGAGASEGTVVPARRDDGEATAPPSDDDATPPVAELPAAPCPQAAALQPGDTTKTLSIDGIQRSFLVHAPPSYDGDTRLPVVFDFHGLSGTSNQQKNLSRWDDIADAQGFITVYPQGIENAWNAGGCCGNTGSDDVGFTRAIIENLTNEACIDTRRVFASGCSNGGGMSYRLACEASDVIAAVAPVDFDCVVGAGCGDCAPARPISVVQFRGTNDQLVPYEGNGQFFLGAQANLATWGEINQCGGEQAPLQGSDGCEAFPMCGEGAQTVLCTVEAGTHCGSYGSFKIPEVAWSILQNVALP